MHFRLSPLIGVAIMTIALTITVTQHAHAQGSGGMNCDNTPCGGDSTVWAWQYPPPFSVPVYTNGCQYNTPQTCCIVTAKYRVRQACFNPKTYQLEILHLSWDRDCGPSFDPVPIIKAVTFGLLTQNPMRFDPRVEDSSAPCNTNYSVQAAICWKNYPGMKAAENCGSDTAGYACCKGGYQVCRKIGPNGPYREVTWLGQSQVTNNCINDPNDPQPCKPSCGAFQEDGIINRKKDDPPGLSAAPAHGTDTTTVSTSPGMIDQKTMLAPQQR